MKLSSLIYLIPIFTSLTVRSSSAYAPTPANADFIRKSCTTTLYPDLCFSSLSGYASAVQNDPARLAQAAIAVSLSRARHISTFLSNISDSNTNPRATSAVHDCRSVSCDAVDNIRDSLRQMFRLGDGGESLQFQLSNVQTWMSAALTNEETCTDGFNNVEDSEMKVKVCGRMKRVKETTSNALALVNNYVSTVRK